MLETIELIILFIVLAILAFIVWKWFPTPEEIAEFIATLPIKIWNAIVTFFKWVAAAIAARLGGNATIEGGNIVLPWGAKIPLAPLQPPSLA